MVKVCWAWADLLQPQALARGYSNRFPTQSERTSLTLFEVALLLGFRAEGPAIYLAQPNGLGDQA